MTIPTGHEAGHHRDRPTRDLWEGGDARRDRYFGKHVEPDRTWTTRHVPAAGGGRHACMDMTGLSRSDATDGMLFLDTRNSGRRTYPHTQRDTPRRRLSALLRAAWRGTGGLSWH